MRRRQSGILLHPTSLAGQWAIGDIGPSALAFLDWIEAAGQTVWQVLPLGPTGSGDSPYGAISSFAGNSLLISPEELVAAGWMPADALPDALPASPSVDFGSAIETKDALLRRAWEHMRQSGDHGAGEAERFAAEPHNRHWLPDYALYVALKRELGGRAWTGWPEALRRREEPSLDEARGRLAGEIAYQTWVQFVFFTQWSALRRHASNRGIEILGDLPIYVALDSADVWAHQELFELDDEGRPLAVAGVPPDYFSPLGQLWGNPLYRWERMRADGYRWWSDRVSNALRLVDILRLDHFRGFAGYWRVPAEATDAREGEWTAGPGADLFDSMRRALGVLPLIAEDLGEITPDVEELRRRLGLSGMKVLQFAFHERDSPHLPHRYAEDCVVYTGTHDNDTTRGWYEGLDADARTRVRDYLSGNPAEIHWSLIRAAQTSVARVAIVPMQDALGLGSEARMNTPGLADGNWRWRLASGDLSAETASRLRRLSEIAGRLEVAATREQGQ